MLNQTVILLPSVEQVTARKVALAQSSVAGTLGIKVLTPSEWLSELWMLWGDGRRIIDARTLELMCFRQLGLVSSINDEGAFHEASTLHQTRGTAKSLAAFYRDVVGHPLFEKSLQSPPSSLSGAERLVLALWRQIASLLDKRGFCLPGQACAYLLDRMPHVSVALEGSHSFSSCFTWFLECQGICWSLPKEAQHPVSPLPKGLAPAFLFPSGPSAITRVVSDCLRSFAREHEAHGGRALVVCVDALSSYREAWPFLADAGCSLELDTTMYLSDTKLGKLARALYEIDQGVATSATVSAVLLSPYSGLSSVEARTLDVRFRSDRTLQFGGTRDFLLESLPHFELLERLFASSFSQSAVDELMALLPDIIPTQSIDYHIEVAALDSLYESFTSAAAVSFDDPWRVVDFALESRVSVKIHAGAANDSASDACLLVRFADMGRSYAQAEKSWDLVIMRETDCVNYSASSPHAALIRLSEKLGVSQPEDSVTLMRERFVHLVDVARRQFACCFCPVALDGSETYPSFFAEELALHYTAGLPVGHNPLGIGDESGAWVAFGDEDTVTENLLPQSSLQVPVSSCIPRQGHFRSGEGSSVSSEGEPFYISASSLETYLSCPRKWFLTRKLKAESLDETLSPMERGSFVHEVWQRFYERFCAEEVRVTEDRLEVAEEMLAQVYDELLEQQESQGKGRYLPVTNDELRYAETLKLQMMLSLAVQSELLPCYRPTHFEFRLLPEDGIEFAGAVLQGAIDRIDEDPDGHYAVLDYKGSVKDHAAGFDPDARKRGSEEPLHFDAGGNLVLPSKIQALMYAQALRRHPDFEGKEPRAALYLSYGAQEPSKSVVGSLSESTDSGVSLPGSSKVVGNFEHYLDLVEEALVPVVDEMRKGSVPPQPKKGACAFCPDLSCPGRC
ncbi:MAG: PD-(D/E)XK nuclease family protein [Coriobacteriia bacterium]|nr:PD-(D/E)XK nuclease family protein [Coriobacteriia bacterium]